MEKFVIIGPPGAGKSTLARKLGHLLNIKVIHLDRVFWQRGWKEKPRDERIDILQNLAAEKQWIIEGSYLNSSEPRLEAADTIIFLDMFPLLCLWSIITRHFRDCKHPRRDLPMDSSDKLSFHLLLKVLLFPLFEKRKLEEMLSEFPTQKVIYLHSRKEVELFLAELELARKASKMPSHREEKAFAPLRGQEVLSREKSLIT
jgi:adenylate kinase family enzyme